MGVRAIRSFTVKVRLPAAISPLRELSTNLRWSWDRRTRDLFRYLDPNAWEATGGNPIRVLDFTSPERLEALAADESFVRSVSEVHDDLQRELQARHWFQERTHSPLGRVAYLSPEFGISESLPQYSGGLGVLAGDHLKESSALGLPLVAVGLLYRQGYFAQLLEPDGWQSELYPDLEPESMALLGPLDDEVSVQTDDTCVRARIWRAAVGRISLYLLDGDAIQDGAPLGTVSDRLYGGTTEHRLLQEILLGVGGVRALKTLGERPEVFHTNEGHAGFQGLERIRSLVTDEGLRFDEALEVVRASTVFTTHTPVAAGIDRFPAELMARHFGSWAEECDVPFSRLMELGRFPGEAEDAPFNMAVMGLHLSSRANGVSALHGSVSRAMFHPLWPTVEQDEVPIGSVTNGVHPETWVSSEMSAILEGFVHPTWPEAPPEDWAKVEDIPDERLWVAREQARAHLVATVRARLRSYLSESGLTESELSWCDDVLDPEVLTIGFARRFATYKRAALLLSDLDRLKALLLDADRPVQIIFAGKAHPADEKGKELIRSIVAFSKDPSVRKRIVFLQGYDIALARSIYQGADLWLNHPRRPMEACGTSGMKAALNGALNCSVRDGWWDELYDGSNGWAIASVEVEEDLERRDAAEASSLFSLLEGEIAPLFYDRLPRDLPRGWVKRMKTSLATLGPSVTASRMLKEYTTVYYEPSAALTKDLSANGYERAKELAAWKLRVTAAWPSVHVESVHCDDSATELFSRREVRASVELGQLSPADVVVQLLHGPVAANGELVARSVTTMDHSGAAEAGWDHGGGNTQRYEGQFDCEQAGRYGFTLRVMPSHPCLVTPVEMGLVSSA